MHVSQPGERPRQRDRRRQRGPGRAGAENGSEHPAAHRLPGHAAAGRAERPENHGQDTARTENNDVEGHRAMSETQNNQHIDQVAQAIGNTGLISPLPTWTAVPKAPEPDEVWQLGAGNAWVYYGSGNDGLVRPLILSDGFDSGPSSLDHIWDSWNSEGTFAFFTKLLDSGRDLIIVGYHERSASIQDNAAVVTKAITKAIHDRTGNAELVVGGYSMGGLITRYALTKMEHDGPEHQTHTYFSYDTPHRGAWVPISLQAFAHYSAVVHPDVFAPFSDQINSPAARQMLWRHIHDYNETPAEDPLRTKFLTELHDFGGWPRHPRKIGVANGLGTGVGNGDVAGAEALKSTGVWLNQTTLDIQQSGNHQKVASLRNAAVPPRSVDVYTDGIPDGDGAPGGQLNSFQIVAEALLGLADNKYRDACFIPTVSAAAIRDLGTHNDLYVNVNSLPTSESELDEFQCSTDKNEGHIYMSPEHGQWLLDRLPA
ncbi:esterase/lipase family protein [Streptomyces sp. NPDC002788]